MGFLYSRRLSLSILTCIVNLTVQYQFSVLSLGDKYVQLEDGGQIRSGFPKLIKETFPTLPAKLDAVLSLELQNGPVYFFKVGQILNCHT